MPQSKGYKVKTRKLLRKKGNPGFSDRLLTLENLSKGDKVVIYINPRFQENMPHRRYHGKIGVVKGRRGKSFIVEVSKGDKKVLLIVPPEHLRPHLT